MGKKGLVRVAFFVSAVLGIVLFSNCSAKHSSLEDSASNSAFLKCTAILEDEFQKGYYPFLKNNCAACHSVGGSGNGAFADELPNIAFEQFNLRGNTLVSDRALDPNHQAGITGPQHQGALDPLETAWNDAMARKQACDEAVLSDQDDDGSNTTTPPPATASIFTSSKTIGAGNNPSTLSWNLASEIVEPAGTSVAGVTFSMQVQAGQTATGDRYYQFSLPTLQTGNSNIRIAVIELRINGELESSASTYKGINQIVEANQNSNLTLTNMIVPRVPAANDTISVGFGIIEETTEAPIAPGTILFSNLVSTGGVISNNCLSCHSGGNPSAGLDLSNYNVVVNNGYVVPGNANNSLIIQRMTDQNNPMPPTGNLNQAQISIVRSWITDGARQ